MTTSTSDTNSENLQISDLQNLLVIVDMASQRGAFKGQELSQVGAVFDRVAKFLQSVAPKTEQSAPPAAPAEQPVPTSTPTPLTTTSTPPFSLLGGNN